MALIRKKKDKKLVVPKAPLMSFEAAMHNTTTLTADEKGEFCHAIFQTNEAISSAEWEVLAQHARNNVRFVISVLKDEDTDDD